MSDLSRTEWPQSDDPKKIKKNLNRLYWAFLVLCLVIAAYMIGWIMAYTGSCVCSTN